MFPAGFRGCIAGRKRGMTGSMQRCVWFKGTIATPSLAAHLHFCSPVEPKERAGIPGSAVHQVSSGHNAVGFQRATHRPVREKNVLRIQICRLCSNLIRQRLHRRADPIRLTPPCRQSRRTRARCTRISGAGWTARSSGFCDAECGSWNAARRGGSRSQVSPRSVCPTHAPQSAQSHALLLRPYDIAQQAVELVDALLE